MKRLPLIAAALVLALPAHAKTPDRPHRPAGQIAVLDMSVADAQACIARELDRTGSVLILPVEGGSDIDFTVPGGMFAQGKGEPYATFRLRDAGEVTLSILYRRPLSAKSMLGSIKDMGKRCLIVKEMRPEPVSAGG